MAQEIKLSLEVAEINQILSALGKEPYVEVFDLVDKIRRQAEQQMGPDGQPQARKSPGVS